MRMIVGGRRGIRCFFRRMVISSAFNRLVDFLEAVKIAANFRMLLRLAHRVQVIKHATYLFIISNASLFHLSVKRIQMALQLAEGVPQKLFFSFLFVLLVCMLILSYA